MSKAILIDAATREIREIENTGLKSLQAAVGGFIETAYSWENGDVLFVDEEGLFKPQSNFFRVPTLCDDQPFAGNGVVVGREVTDDEGEYVRTDVPTITVEALREIVEFRDRAQVDAWAKANASETASAVMFVDKAGNVETTVTGRVGALFADMPRPAEPLGYLVEAQDVAKLREMVEQLGNGERRMNADRRVALWHKLSLIVSRIERSPVKAITVSVGRE